MLSFKQVYFGVKHFYEQSNEVFLYYDGFKLIIKLRIKLEKKKLMFIIYMKLKLKFR